MKIRMIICISVFMLIASFSTQKSHSQEIDRSIFRYLEFYKDEVRSNFNSEAMDELIDMLDLLNQNQMDTILFYYHIACDNMPELYNVSNAVADYVKRAKCATPWINDKIDQYLYEGAVRQNSSCLFDLERQWATKDPYLSEYFYQLAKRYMKSD